MLRVDELGWQERGTWTRARGARWPGGQELLSSPGLVQVIIQQGARHQRFCSNIFAFHMGPKIDRNLATAKQEGKWSDFNVVTGREG